MSISFPSLPQVSLPGASGQSVASTCSATPQMTQTGGLYGLPADTVNITSGGDMGRYYLGLGERYYQANRFREAIDAYTNALNTNSQDVVALNRRGVAKAALKDYPGAIADYTLAIAFQPNFYNAYINRGNLKVYVRDYDGALNDYQRAMRLQPLNSVAYENRAEIYSMMGRQDLALQDRGMVIQLEKLKAPTLKSLPYCPYRIALVLGNDDYAGTENDLSGGPRTDALNMRTVLQAEGFEVLSGLNLTGSQMKQKMAEFIAKLQQHPGAVSMIYYSGHGGSINGNNYLIPVEYTGQINPATIDEQMMSVDFLLKQLKPINSLLNIIVLDACRNPLLDAQALKLKGDSPSGHALLKQWETEPDPGLSNVWIEYASRPRMPALQYDNKGLYTKYLLQYMSQPGLSLKEVSMYASYALEQDPLAQREGQHARTQTDLSHTGPIASAFSFAQPCSPRVV
jgi:tetratricopeptide (TPR) repeat protein